MADPRPALPLDLSTALDRSEPLAALLRRLQASRERFEAVAGTLPPGLRAQVTPGPLDDEGWTLLAAHPAAAAKLRQCIPALNNAATAHGLPPLAVRVKVRSGP